MFKRIVSRYKENPTLYYAMSIVASWAGVGSLMNFRTIALQSGAVPAIIWAVFNSFACILFGLLAAYLPHVRKIMQTKVMAYFIGFLTVFQTWTKKPAASAAGEPLFRYSGQGCNAKSPILHCKFRLWRNRLIRNWKFRTVA